MLLDGPSVEVGFSDLFMLIWPRLLAKSAYADLKFVS